MANKIDHPPTVCLREDAVVPSLDAWLARAFGADQINRSLAAMEASQPDTSVETSQLRRTVADCDRRLARHRAALEAGADPALVAQWTRDVQAERAAALAKLQASPRRGKRQLSQRDIEGLVNALGGMLAVLTDADATEKAELCRQLSSARAGGPPNRPNTAACAPVRNSTGMAQQRSHRPRAS